MPYISIRPLRYKFSFCPMDQLPAFPHYRKSYNDQTITDEMNHCHHYGPTTEECEPEMSACMGKWIQGRISVAEDACKNINCERETIHFSEKGDKKGKR